MSRRARRHGELPFTLFSFQDIMASVTGIVILVTLMLMLELIAKPRILEASAPDVISESPPLDVAAADARIEVLRAQMVDAQATRPEQLAAARRSTHALAELLDVQQQRAAAAARRAETKEAEAAALQRELDQLHEQTARLRRQTALEQNTPRVTVLQDEQGDKRIWYVALGAGEAAVGRIETDTGLTHLHHRFAGDDAIDDLLAWALTQPAGQERFVLLVRPDGVEAYQRAQAVLRGAGFDLGWDVWTQDVDVFSTPRSEVPHGPRR